MNPQQLTITCPSGIAQESKIELDGDDISSGLTGVDLHVRGGDYVTAELHLLCVAGSFEGQAQVVLPEETQTLLKRLGWTPPSELA